MRTSLPILAPLLLAASSVTAGFDNVFHNSILNARGPLPATLPNNESKMAMLLHRRDLSDGVNGFNKMVKTRKVGTLQARYLNAKPHIEERDGEDEEEEDSCEAEDGSEDVDNDGDCYKEDSEGDKTGLNLNATVQISLSGKNPTVSGAKLVANASTSGTAVSSPSLSSVLVVSPSSSSVIVASPSPSSVIVASPSSSSGIVASPSASSIVVSASASASTSTFAAPAANVTAPSINVTTPANMYETSHHLCLKRSSN